MSSFLHSLQKYWSPRETTIIRTVLCTKKGRCSVDGAVCSINTLLFLGLKETWVRKHLTVQNIVCIWKLCLCWLTTYLHGPEGVADCSVPAQWRNWRILSHTKCISMPTAWNSIEVFQLGLFQEHPPSRTGSWSITLHRSPSCNHCCRGKAIIITCS